MAPSITISPFLEQLFSNLFTTPLYVSITHPNAIVSQDKTLQGCNVFLANSPTGLMLNQKK